MTTTVTMSLAEYLARPEEHHTEWSQGTLIMTPAASGPHQYAARGLIRSFEEGCPAAFVVLHEMGWLLTTEGPYRVPDIVVIERSDARDLHLTRPPLLAVEVLSPAERPEIKAAEYAQAGLDHYWTFDLEARVLTAYRRSGADFTIVAIAEPGHVLRVGDPFDTQVDPADLLP